MRQVFLVIALLFSANDAALGESVPGADDPAFRVPFERALQGDDPTALQEIYAAAEAGNEAALRALPTVLNWLPPQGSFAEKKRYRSINGVPLDQAVAAVSPVAAAWNSGKGIEARPFDKRIESLANAGEIGKASTLYEAWSGQERFNVPVSPDATRIPLPVFALASQLAFRLAYTNEAADELFTVDLLRKDRFEAWLALGQLTQVGTTNPTRVPFLTKAATLLTRAGVDPSTSRTKMTEALALRNWYYASSDQKDPAQAEAVVTLLRGRPEFNRIEAFCGAACPETAQNCELAWLSVFSPDEGVSESLVPEVALISNNDFFATPRGASLIFPANLDMFARAGSLDRILAPAEKLDRCLADEARRSVKTR